MILKSYSGYTAVELAIKEAALRIINKKIDQFDFRPICNSSSNKILNQSTTKNDDNVFEDWDDLDTNILNMVVSESFMDVSFSDTISWLCNEQLFLRVQFIFFSVDELFGNSAIQKFTPLPLNGSIQSVVQATQALSEFFGLILFVGCPQKQLLYQGFQCHNSKCKSYYLTRRNLFWIGLKSSSLPYFCPACSEVLVESISARKFTSLNIIILLTKSDNNAFLIYKLFIPTENIQMNSLTVGHWMHILGYSDSIFKNPNLDQSFEESFMIETKTSLSYPIWKVELEIFSVLAIQKLSHFYSANNYLQPVKVSSHYKFKDIIGNWTDTLSFGLNAFIFPQYFRLALVISIVSSLTSYLGKPLHLIIFHKQEYFVTFILSKIKKYFWNFPWSSTEECNLKIIQSIQKYIDSSSHLVKSETVSDFPLSLQLSRNSIFRLHLPLFKFKKFPFDIGHLFSSQCPCALLAHTDTYYRNITSNADSSITNVISSFDILIEYTSSMSSEKVANELFDLYQSSYDVSEFMSLILSISSFIAGMRIFSIDWSAEAKESIQNYFIATRKSSTNPQYKGDQFDLKLPEISTSQLEIKELSSVTPKYSHVGYESPTSIIERIVRLSIVLSCLSIPFNPSKKVISVRLEEVILRYAVYMVILSIWYIDHSMYMKIGTSILSSVPFPLLDFDDNIRKIDEIIKNLTSS